MGAQHGRRSAQENHRPLPLARPGSGDRFVLLVAFGGVGTAIAGYSDHHSAVHSGTHRPQRRLPPLHDDDRSPGAARDHLGLAVAGLGERRPSTPSVTVDFSEPLAHEQPVPDAVAGTSRKVGEDRPEGGSFRPEGLLRPRSRRCSSASRAARRGPQPLRPEPLDDAPEPFRHRGRLRAASATAPRRARLPARRVRAHRVPATSTTTAGDTPPAVRPGRGENDHDDLAASASDRLRALGRG